MALHGLASVTIGVPNVATHSDMDCDIDDALWKPEVFEGQRGLYAWGPPPPPSCVHPDDLAEPMAGSHSGG